MFFTSNTLKAIKTFFKAHRINLMRFDGFIVLLWLGKNYSAFLFISFGLITKAADSIVSLFQQVRVL